MKIRKTRFDEFIIEPQNQTDKDLLEFHANDRWSRVSIVKLNPMLTIVKKCVFGDTYFPTEKTFNIKSDLISIPKYTLIRIGPWYYWAAEDHSLWVNYADVLPIDAQECEAIASTADFLKDSDYAAPPFFSENDEAIAVPPEKKELDKNSHRLESKLLDLKTQICRTVKEPVRNPFQAIRFAHLLSIDLLSFAYNYAKLFFLRGRRYLFFRR